MPSLLSFFRKRVQEVRQGQERSDGGAIANASCLATRRPIYVTLANSGGATDTYAAHYVDSTWNGGWWFFHVTNFCVWSRYSLALYLRHLPPTQSGARHAR